MEDALLEKDIAKIIENNYNDLYRLFSDTYINSKKIDQENFNSYMKAIRAMLDETFISGNGIALSYYEYLKEYYPSMTYQDYHDKHRNRFEYMAKLSKRTISQKIKEILD